VSDGRGSSNKICWGSFAVRSALLCPPLPCEPHVAKGGPTKRKKKRDEYKQIDKVHSSPSSGFSGFLFFSSPCQVYSSLSDEGYLQLVQNTH
jgi:hypothetical protein